ncbi:MAG TPA: ABC transporter ATP-binding protein, partial [Mycobacterium sp.]|nr:ABC transporter ATP-binding protein [Mycobacterium sp.]
AAGSPHQLIREYATREVVELRVGVGEQDVSVDKVADLGVRTELLPDRILVYTDDGDAAAAMAYQRGLASQGVLVRRSTLEDVFLRLTGRTLVD